MRWGPGEDAGRWVPPSQWQHRLAATCVLLGILSKFLKCLTRITVKSFIARRERDGDSAAEIFEEETPGKGEAAKKGKSGGKKETANDVLKCNSTFMKYSLPQTRLILKIKCPGICPSDFEALIYDLSKAANLMIHNRSGRNTAAPKGKSWERDGGARPCSGSAVPRGWGGLGARKHRS